MTDRKETPLGFVIIQIVLIIAAIAATGFLFYTVSGVALSTTTYHNENVTEKSFDSEKGVWVIETTNCRVTVSNEQYLSLSEGDKVIIATKTTTLPFITYPDVFVGRVI